MSSLMKNLIATLAAAIGFTLSGFTTYAVLETIDASATSVVQEQTSAVEEVITTTEEYVPAPNTKRSPVHEKFTAEQVAVVEELAYKHRDAVFIIFTDDGSQGSGFLIAPDVVITNHHVVSPWDGGEPTTATIKTRDGKRISATYITGDAQVDVAALRLSEPITDVEPLVWSTTEPAIGDTLMYIGNPAIVGGWFVGIGSATSREYNVLLTDLPIASGASGSPIMNMKGEVVSIASGIYDIPELSSIGDVFVHEVIPANPVRNAGGSEIDDILRIVGGSY